MHFRMPLVRKVYLLSIGFIIVKLAEKTYYFEYHFQILSFEIQINYVKLMLIEINCFKWVHSIEYCLMQQIYHSLSVGLNYTFNINFKC